MESVFASIESSDVSGGEDESVANSGTTTSSVYILVPPVLLGLYCVRL